MDRMIPEEIRELLQRKELDPGPVIEVIISISKVLGYGRFDWVDYRYKLDDGDYAVVRVENPYSVTLGLVDPAAVLEAITGYEGGFEFKQVAEGVYEVRVFRSGHLPEFKQRLLMKTRGHREGGIALESCASCGASVGLSSYIWDLDGGVIRGRYTGRRMAVFSPTVLDAVLEELERELGGAIPEAVVEAQRRFTKTGAYAPGEIGDEGRLRSELALRGVGDLKRFEAARSGLRLRIDNAAMHLVVVGLIQGIHEMAFGVESAVEWEFSDEGDLEVEVAPRTQLKASSGEAAPPKRPLLREAWVEAEAVRP